LVKGKTEAKKTPQQKKKGILVMKEKDTRAAQPAKMSVKTGEIGQRTGGGRSLDGEQHQGDFKEKTLLCK